MQLELLSGVLRHVLAPSRETAPIVALAADLPNVALCAPRVRSSRHAQVKGRHVDKRHVDEIVEGSAKDSQRRGTTQPEQRATMLLEKHERKPKGKQLQDARQGS